MKQKKNESYPKFVLVIRQSVGRDKNLTLSLSLSSTRFWHRHLSYSQFSLVIHSLLAEMLSGAQISILPSICPCHLCYVGTDINLTLNLSLSSTVCWQRCRLEAVRAKEALICTGKVVRIGRGRKQLKDDRTPSTSDTAQATNELALSENEDGEGSGDGWGRGIVERDFSSE